MPPNSIPAAKAPLTLVTLGLQALLLLTSRVQERWPTLVFDAGALAAAAVLLAYWAFVPFRLRIHWSLGAPVLAAAIGAFQILCGTAINPNATLLASLDWMGLAALFFLAQQMFAIDWELRRYFGLAAIVFPVLYCVYATVAWFVSSSGGGIALWGSIGNRNHYAAFMELFLPVVFWYFLGSPRKNPDAGFATGLLAISIAASASAGGFMVAILEFIAVFLLRHYWDARDRMPGPLVESDGPEPAPLIEFRQRRGRRRLLDPFKRGRPIDMAEISKTVAKSVGGFLSGRAGQVFWLKSRMFAAVVVLLAAVAILPLERRMLDSRVGKLLADYGQPRREYRVASLHMIAARPVLGFGLGSWSEVYPAYRSDEAPRTAVNHASNDPLEWLADGGLLFLVPLTLLAAVCVRSGFDQPWALGPLGVLIHSLVSDPFREPAILACLLLVLAAAIERSRRTKWA